MAHSGKSLSTSPPRVIRGYVKETSVKKIESDNYFTPRTLDGARFYFYDSDVSKQSVTQSNTDMLDGELDDLQNTLAVEPSAHRSLL